MSLRETLGQWLAKELIKQRLEREIVEWIIDRHWPAVSETLREQFGQENIDIALKAGRVACERLIEHML